MSYIPPEQLEGASLITQYVIDCRAKGHFLPYDEHRLLNKWLALSSDADALLVILSDILPEFYAKGQHKSQPPSLSRLDKKLSLILNQTRTQLNTRSSEI
ncbi:MAG: hypothetical protein NTX25_14520 [Proteobacteria bacterium]|nr:hypothetical protein [Pseudomonadota bacterium]